MLFEEPAFISSTDDVSLEARIHQGDIHRNKNVCVIITHPYGRLGGNLHNNVVEECFETFASQGFMTVRFNFRGVGKSTGRSTFRGMGELEDVLAVYRYVKERADLAPRHFILCGYSYGSIATCAVNCEIPECIGIIAIAYPAGVLWFLTVGNSAKYVDGLKSAKPNLPKLFIIGSRDNFTSVKAFEEFVDKVPEPKQKTIIDGVDHFWGGREEVISETIRIWIKSCKVLPPKPKANPLPPIESLRDIREQQKLQEREERRRQKSLNAMSESSLPSSSTSTSSSTANVSRSNSPSKVSPTSVSASTPNLSATPLQSHAHAAAEARAKQREQERAELFRVSPKKSADTLASASTSALPSDSASASEASLPSNASVAAPKRPPPRPTAPSPRRPMNSLSTSTADLVSPSKRSGKALSSSETLGSMSEPDLTEESLLLF